METLEKSKVFIRDEEIQWEEVHPGVRRKIMTYDERVMLVKVEFETGSIGPLHHHYHSQITHLEKGVFEVEIGGRKNILKAGDAFYIPTDVVHGVVCLEAGTLIDIFSPMREDFIKADNDK